MVRGCPDPVIQFDLPQPEDEKEAGPSAPAGDADADDDDSSGDDPPARPAADAHAGVAPAERQAFYCLTGNLLVVTDNREVLEGIWDGRWGHSRGSLAEHLPFQMVMNRCRADYGKGGEMPQMRWFIHPLGYAEASRAATPENRRRKGKTILEVMRHQGVEAIRGIGGFADFASEDYELVHRTAVYAPRPYREAMKMAVLLNRDDFTPQSWVPRTSPPTPVCTSTSSTASIISGRCSTNWSAASGGAGRSRSTASRAIPRGR